jgi:hypothetical protein
MAKQYTKQQEEAVKKDLPTKGRKGDTMLAHVTRGEMVIPVKLLDADDGYLREMLSDVMKEVGMNPAQFTVGDKANKINPETGYPEFGWFSSIVKSVKKAVKKVVNTAKKVVKAVAKPVASVVKSVAKATGLAPDAPAQTEAPSTTSYTANNRDSGNEKDAEVKKKSQMLKRGRRGKRRLRINQGGDIGTANSGSGVNAGSGSGVNVPRG